MAETKKIITFPVIPAPSAVIPSSAALPISCLYAVYILAISFCRCSLATGPVVWQGPDGFLCFAALIETDARA